MSVKKIDENITIEELVNLNPLTVRFLMEKGIRCLRCGEPIWGTLKEAAIEKGYKKNSLPGLIAELNEYLRK